MSNAESEYGATPASITTSPHEPDVKYDESLHGSDVPSREERLPSGRTDMRSTPMLEVVAFVADDRSSPRTVINSEK